MNFMYGKFFQKHSLFKRSSSSIFSPFPGKTLTAKESQQIHLKKLKTLLIDDHLIIREAGDGEEAMKLA